MYAEEKNGKSFGTPVLRARETPRDMTAMTIISLFRRSRRAEPPHKNRTIFLHTVASTVHRQILHFLLLFFLPRSSTQSRPTRPPTDRPNDRPTERTTDRPTVRPSVRLRHQSPTTTTAHARLARSLARSTPTHTATLPHVRAAFRLALARRSSFALAPPPSRRSPPSSSCTSGENEKSESGKERERKTRETERETEREMHARTRVCTCYTALSQACIYVCTHHTHTHTYT